MPDDAVGPPTTATTGTAAAGGCAGAGAGAGVRSAVVQLFATLSHPVPPAAGAGGGEARVVTGGGLIGRAVDEGSSDGDLPGDVDSATLKTGETRPEPNP